MAGMTAKEYARPSDIIIERLGIHPHPYPLKPRPFPSPHTRPIGKYADHTTRTVLHSEPGLEISRESGEPALVIIIDCTGGVE